MTTLTPSDIQHFLTAEESDPRWKEITETLNVAICEWLGLQTEGWWCPKCDREVACAFVTYDETHVICGTSVEGMSLPCHTRGKEALNNLHEAEKKLTEDNQRYRYFYFELTRFWNANQHSEQETAASATARQRAVALVRVVASDIFYK